ncbi:SET domain-containing protein 9-like isoform X1 [Octopus sinensis]|uniref:SET domain-containing protein 9-like isoform X1 n=1 Tax=Octopus sinensis TaxID=2607531 RepID=A0A7E6F0U9_9MOLL|nr:SET domain-containing protein 9-like isoform X1 [Octopus sinensis]
MALMSSWIKRWRQYRHRFTPWLAFNWTNRTKRHVESPQSDKLIPDSFIREDLLRFCESLYRYETAKETFRNCEDFCKTTNFLSRNPFSTNADIHLDSLALSHEILGFTLERKSSSLSEAGGGIFVTKGSIPANTFVCLYPGTVYRVHDPLFFQSLKNQFIFRCADQIHIDGNDRGLSKIIFKSCTHRDRRFPYWTADATWMSTWPVNPLAVGQYVNNQTPEFPANVAYQEFDISSNFPIHLSRYLPYVEYSGGLNLYNSVNGLLRGVALVSLRSIHAGEELFSTYFTVIEAPQQ